MIKPLTIVSTVAAFSFSTAILAHDFWVQPSDFTPQPGELVNVHLYVGHVDAPEPVKRNSTRIEKFSLLGIDGETPIPGSDGKDPAGLVRPAKAGLHIVVYDSNHARSELEADKFEAYLREEGLESIITERKKRSESSKAGVEIYSRCAKALVCVGEAPFKGSADRAVGLKLELITGSNPAALKPGDDVSISLMFDGQPLEGVKVILKSGRQPHGASEARTGKDGNVTLKAPDAGLCVITAVHMIRLPEGSDADWESIWASLSFKVAAQNSGK